MGESKIISFLVRREAEVLRSERKEYKEDKKTGRKIDKDGTWDLCAAENRGKNKKKSNERTKH